MPSTELDVPVLVTPDQIRRREFVTTRRGYDAGQVRDYLEQLARQVEQMQGMLREARLAADSAARAQAGPRTDPYEELAHKVAEVLRTADREAEHLRKEARIESETILREARADADRIRLDAQSKAEEARDEAERALREARERADRTIAGLSTRRDVLVEQLASMQERLLNVAHELEAAIEPAAEPPEMPDIPSAFEADDTATGDLEAEQPAADEPLPEVVDLGAQELWAGDEEVELQIPEIPPLDLDWESDPED